MGAVAEDIRADYASSQTTGEPQHSPEQVTELVQLIKSKPVPSFKSTLNKLLKFQDKPNASIPKIVDILRLDPGYSLQLISTVNSKLLELQKDEVHSLSHAVLVLGIPKVIAVGHELPVLEDIEDSQTLAEIYRCLSRSYHAAVQARECTRDRGKTTAEAAFLSAQLREMYLINLWYYAPEKVHELLKNNNLPTLCFPGGLLNAVGKETARYAHLPKTLQESYTPEAASSHLIKSVEFACNLTHLSHHAENGWYSKQISELVGQASMWIGYEEEELHSKVHQNAVIAARESFSYPVRPVASRLVELEMPNEPLPKAKKKTSTAKPIVGAAFHDQLAKLLNMGKTSESPTKILKSAFEVLHEELVDLPCAFLLLDKTRNCLKSRYAVGFADTTSAILLPLDKPSIFKKLMQKQQSVWINPDTRAGFSKLLPGNIKLDVKNQDFVAMSLFVNGKPVGLFYVEVDMANPETFKLYKKFIALCKTTRAAMEEVQKHAKSKS